MSDHADSERTRNCTRLLYSATRRKPNSSTTARTIQAIAELLRCGFKGTLAAKEQSFKVSKFRGFTGSDEPGSLATLKPGPIALERSSRGGHELADLFSEP